MEREIFKFENEEQAKGAMFYEDGKEFVLVEENQTYYDSEKGCSDYELILQRNSDKKFFKGQYTKWPAGGFQIELEIEEVFPTQVTTTIYK